MVHEIYKLSKFSLFLLILLLVHDSKAQNINWALTSSASAVVTGVTNVTANSQTQGSGISSVVYTTNGASANGYDGSLSSTCQPNSEDSLSFSFSVNSGVKVITSVEFTHRRVSGVSSNCCWQLSVKVGNGAPQNINTNISTNAGSQTSILNNSTNPAIFPLTVNSGNTVYFTLRGDASNSTDILAVKDFTLNIANCNLNLSSTVTNVDCFGDLTGDINLSVTNGTNPISYLWSNGATTQDITTLIAGTYTVTVTDANSCTATQTSSVTQPTPLNSSTSITNVTCFNQSNGNINASFFGGTQFSSPNPPYVYLWSTGATTEDIIGLSGGTYSVTITDANNCTANFTNLVVQEPKRLTIDSTITNIDCFGSNNGIIVLDPEGGNPGAIQYFFQWNTGNTTGSISNLAPGFYTVTVTDGICSTIPAAITMQITEPGQLNIVNNPGVTNIDCFGDNTGAIDITVTGGVPSFSYLWSNGATTQDITTLIAGTYTLTVTDNNSCTDIASYTISQNSQIVITLDNIDNVNCFGESNGSIYISTSGGVPFSSGSAYTFNWSNSNTTQDLNNVIAGNYSVVVTDALGCTSLNTNGISEPGELLIQNDNVIPVLCEGQSTGSISYDIVGGTFPFTFSWSNGATTQNITSLIAGTYSITVTDAHNCIFNTTFNVGTTNFKSQDPSTIASSDTVICSGDSISLYVTGSLGTFGQFKWYEGGCPSGSSGSSIGNGNPLKLTLNNSTAIPIIKEFYVRAEDPSPCANYTTCKSVPITINPVPKLTSTDTLEICSGEPLNYQILTDVNSNMTFGWTPISVSPGISDTTSQPPGINSILNDALLNNSFNSIKNVIYKIDLIFTDNGLACPIDTTIFVKVNPKPEVPSLIELLNPDTSLISSVSLCGGTNAYSFIINNATAGLSYLWNTSSSNVTIEDTTNSVTVISFEPQSNSYQTNITVTAENDLSIGACKATSSILNIQVSSGDAIVEREIVPKEPGHLLVYLDNSSDLRYHWGYDSIEVVNGNTKRLVNPKFIPLQFYQMFVPPSKFIQPASGSVPEQLDTVHYAYWVQVIKISQTDTCYTRVYYNGPYCTFCGNRPDEENISSEIVAKIWPNPASKFIQISVSGNIYGRINARIVNSFGQLMEKRTLVKQEVRQEFTYEIGQLPPGFYQLLLFGDDEEKIALKFVILDK